MSDPGAALERYESAVRRQRRVTSRLERLVERLERLSGEELRDIRETPLPHDGTIEQEDDGV